MNKATTAGKGSRLNTFPDDHRRHVQTLLVARVGSQPIGPDEATRREAFTKIVTRLLLESFTIVDERMKPIQGVTLCGGHIDQLVEASIRYYSSRDGFLSVTDYVTDLLDIVEDCKMIIVPK